VLERTGDAGGRGRDQGGRDDDGVMDDWMNTGLRACVHS